MRSGWNATPWLRVPPTQQTSGYDTESKTNGVMSREENVMVKHRTSCGTDADAGVSVAGPLDDCSEGPAVALEPSSPTKASKSRGQLRTNTPIPHIPTRTFLSLRL